MGTKIKIKQYIINIIINSSFKINKKLGIHYNNDFLSKEYLTIRNDLIWFKRKFRFMFPHAGVQSLDLPQFSRLHTWNPTGSTHNTYKECWIENYWITPIKLIRVGSSTSIEFSCSWVWSIVSIRESSFSLLVSKDITYEKLKLASK